MFSAGRDGCPAFEGTALATNVLQAKPTIEQDEVTPPPATPGAPSFRGWSFDLGQHRVHVNAALVIAVLASLGVWALMGWALVALLS